MLLIFVIRVSAEMFDGWDENLPKPTLILFFGVVMGIVMEML